MKKRYTLEQKRWDDPVEHAMPEHSRVPASFNIGNVQIAPATVLAPMAGVTDTVFRRFIKNASQFTASAGTTADELASAARIDPFVAASASVSTLGAGIDSRGCEREETWVESLNTVAGASVAACPVFPVCGKGNSSKIVANNMCHLSSCESCKPFPTRNDCYSSGRPLAPHWALSYILVGTLL